MTSKLNLREQLWRDLQYYDMRIGDKDYPYATAIANYIQNLLNKVPE